MNVIISAQEYYRWWRDPIIWSAIFTGVIAIETLVYLILTARLWRATKKAAEAATISAEAAKVSSDASKQSAEIAVGLHRPFVGLTHLIFRDGMNTRTWGLSWTIKNFGTLPATHVDAALDWKAGLNEGTGIGPSSGEIFPQAEVESIALIKLTEMLPQQMFTGDQILQLHARVNYSAEDGRRFLYTADAQWNHESAAFMMLSSQTQPA
jgi:hypothetical protein